MLCRLGVSITQQSAHTSLLIQVRLHCLPVAISLAFCLMLLLQVQRGVKVCHLHHAGRDPVCMNANGLRSVGCPATERNTSSS